ncbi:MAG: hypothetical protein GW848_06275 [Rhodoferax sp.]|nr:hypothetical protein [Rhodoferax sp.]NCP54603.1 hypothetical protein [Rhodoferax sp.]PIY23863.1 MAG: hypothetical protein COZ10_08215 [Comamonadaceae bacterium CG_4_10_14_3_um_filter_60_75]PJC11439.1 MAG: hypothetical protein CO066_15610 [Comamonadaceae bacterium CG_4_9_14_0_8_um_filter_60_18]
MSWTNRTDLRAQAQKLWDKGDLLRALIDPATWQPRRLKLVVPSSGELGDQIEAVRAWLTELRRVPQVRIEWRAFTHRVLGESALPDEVWLDTPQAACALIGKTQEAQRLAALLQQIHAQDGVLAQQIWPWLTKRPLSVLDLANDWPRLLAVLRWLQAHSRPGIYLRQVDLPGVDSKFIESQRAVLTELLDLCLPPAAIDPSATGLSGFCRRYGFKDKPLRIRLRVLDAALAVSGLGADQDITLTQADFAQRDWRVQRVFMTENEVNFLAFPNVPGSLVVFGAGYGFDALKGADWLLRCEVFYWGDIDTHGFAILDQLRSHLPHAQSLLMDHATLLAHRAQWGTEPQPVLRHLPRLTPEESAVFNALRDNRLQTQLRLEQERIGFGWLKAALQALPDLNPPETS